MILSIEFKIVFRLLDGTIDRISDSSKDGILDGTINRISDDLKDRLLDDTIDRT